MKYLFVVQGEGRGHMMQAISLRDMLVQNGHEVVEVLVGKSPHRQIPTFFIEKIQTPVYSFDSPNLLPADKVNNVPVVKSVIYNVQRSPQFVESIRFLYTRIKEQKPDVVVNFYDLLISFLYEVRRPKPKFVCIAHQYFFLHPDFKFPQRFHPEMTPLLFYSRMTCLRADKILALSFGTKPKYNKKGIIIVPPLLRKEVLQATPTTGDYILGYMLNPGFESQVMQWHQNNPEHSLHFFWDKQDADTETKVDDTLTLHRINDELFVARMAGCKAYASTSGFESICEALYLQKPVLMIPTHIEQVSNAIDAERAGAGITADVFDMSQLLDFLPDYKSNKPFRRWAASAETHFLYHLTTFNTRKSRHKLRKYISTRYIKKLVEVIGR